MLSQLDIAEALSRVGEQAMRYHMALFTELWAI